MVNNKEPIREQVGLIYTERKDGIIPDYDIRTDRFDIAAEAKDKATKSALTRRQQRIDALLKKDDPKKDGGAEPTHATGGPDQNSPK